MQYRMLGASGMNASVIAFGAWAVGGWMWGGNEEKDSIAAIQAAIDSGINLIDTAPIYGFGHSEVIVGKAIKGRRDKVIIASKCGLVWNTDKGDEFFSSSEKTIDDDSAPVKYNVRRYLGAKSIRYEVEQSLQRLGIDEIDVMQTHWQETTTPIEESMSELVKLKKEGKIKAIGCSNATPEQMDEYRQVGQLDVDQEIYSMIDRGMESSNLKYCADNKIAFFAYSPLGRGLLTGGVGPERVFNPGDQRIGDERFTVENRKKAAKLLESFTDIAKAHSASLAQLVAAWTFSQRGCSHILAGARNIKQAQENARAGSIVLTKDELAEMNGLVDRLAKDIA